MARIGGNPGNKGGGRKSHREELELIKHYELLLPRVFEIVTEMLNSKSKKDRLVAIEWIKTGLVKMIPQINKIGGDPNNQTPIPIYSAKSIKE